MADEIIVLGNGLGWWEKSVAGLKRESIKLINGYPVNSRIVKFFIKVFYSKKTPRLVKKYLKNYIYRLFIENLQLNNGKRKIIIIYDWNKIGNDIDFLKILKDKGILLIYVFTNIVKITNARQNNCVYNLNDWYDIVFAFDPEDAKKYNFSYSPLIYDADKSYNRNKTESKNNLVFYVGQAKDRLAGLLSCYEKLKKLGIDTDFHIANVKKEDIKYQDEIVYNKFMSYDDAVKSIQKATCLIDVIQGDSTGLTIKTCEAICYDKKLITTNKHIKDYPFYDERYIRVVESPDDIDASFFTENRDVHYSEEGKKYFSADMFLQRVEDELERRG